MTVTLEAGPTVVGGGLEHRCVLADVQTDSDYIVMAFLTDYEGNILDTAGRPLSSWQEDPQPELGDGGRGGGVGSGGDRAGDAGGATFTLANGLSGAADVRRGPRD